MRSKNIPKILAKMADTLNDSWDKMSDGNGSSVETRDAAATESIWCLNDKNFNDISGEWPDFRDMLKFEEGLKPDQSKEFWRRFHGKLVAEGYPVPDNCEDLKPYYIVKRDDLRFEKELDELVDNKHFKFTIGDIPMIQVEALDLGLQKNIKNAKGKNHKKRKATQVVAATNAEAQELFEERSHASPPRPVPATSKAPPYQEVVVTAKEAPKGAIDTELASACDDKMSLSEQATEVLNVGGWLATKEDLQVHTGLRSEIEKLETVQECASFYDSSTHFQEFMRALRHAQDAYVKGKGRNISVIEARMEWAKMWAIALSKDEDWAWGLNHCRKTALELLYRVCNLCFVCIDDEISWSQEELEETFKFYRIDEILIHCLVMDRANSLFNMTIRSTGEVGLGWYSKYDASKYQKKFQVPLNPRGPSINKRLWWLFQVPTFRDDDAIQRWMQIAIPERLQKE